MGAYPPLDGSEWLADSSQASIAIVLKGVEGPLTVKGETFQGQMPPLGETLKDEEIAEILTYVRSSWSNSAPAVEVTTVSQLRQTLTKQVGPWNGEEELLDYLGDQAPERSPFTLERQEAGMHRLTSLGCC